MSDCLNEVRMNFIQNKRKLDSKHVENKFLNYLNKSNLCNFFIGIPALTRYKSAPSTGVLDITIPDTYTWLLQKLKKVTKDYKIDSFFLDFGTCQTC